MQQPNGSIALPAQQATNLQRFVAVIDAQLPLFAAYLARPAGLLDESIVGSQRDAIPHPQVGLPFGKPFIHQDLAGVRLVPAEVPAVQVALHQPPPQPCHPGREGQMAARQGVVEESGTGWRRCRAT